MAEPELSFSITANAPGKGNGIYNSFQKTLTIKCTVDNNPDNKNIYVNTRIYGNCEESISADRITILSTEKEKTFACNFIGGDNTLKKIDPNTYIVLHISWAYTDELVQGSAIYSFIRGRDTVHDTLGYLSTSDTALSMKKAYIGDSTGKARKIKKAYIGDSTGKAQLIYQALPSGVKFEQCNAAKRTALLGWARAGDYAVFAGGKSYILQQNSNGTLYQSKSSVLKTVTAISKNMTTSSVYNLPETRTEGGGVSVGGNAIIGGGWGDAWAKGDVWMWDSSLTRKTLTSIYAMGLNGTTKAGLYGIFAGGWHTEFLHEYTCSDAYAYSSSGSQQKLTKLSYDSLGISKNAYIGGTGLLIDPAKSKYHSYDMNLTQKIAAFEAVTNANDIANMAYASSEDYAIAYNSKDNSITQIDSSLTFKKVMLSAKVVSYPQAAYLPKATELTPNGCFLIYNAVSGSYLLFDAKTGTLLKDSQNNTANPINLTEYCGCVDFSDSSVFYNPLGNYKFFKPTND